MNVSQKLLMTVNGVIISAVFVLNYFYQSNGFDFTLKCICSMGFALLGIINLGYVLAAHRENFKFHFCMALGLVLAMLGDVVINSDFIVGAGVFALGHVSFVVAYCFLQKLRWLDLAVSGVFFLGAGSFLLFCPLLTFDEPVFRIVCLVYALIISFMLGKAIGNFVRERRLVTGLIAVASALFFFSDLMLVLDWFIGRWDWTSEACMGTYYPALCLLALSMAVKAVVCRQTKEA